MTRQATSAPAKRRGRKPTGRGTLVGVRLQPPLLAALDKFIADNSAETTLTRPKAVRLLLTASLEELDILKVEDGE